MTVKLEKGTVEKKEVKENKITKKDKEMELKEKLKRNHKNRKMLAINENTNAKNRRNANRVNMLNGRGK